MSKEHGPGLFGKRVNVESALVGPLSKEIHQQIKGSAREQFLEETREMNDRERKLVLQAEKIIDGFLFRLFSDHLLRISDAKVRIANHSWESRNAFQLNEFIELSPLQNRSERARLDFLNIAVHEMLHYASARRHHVARTIVVDQVGIAVASVGGTTSQRWFEGLNEAMISSLQHRLVTDFALSKDSDVSEDLKRQMHECREQALTHNDNDSVVRLRDKEIYPSFENSGKINISGSYFDVRMFLRLLIEKVAESSGRTVELVQEQFDRLAMYGWDDQAKQDIIKVVGSDGWRALAWMKPEEFLLMDKRKDGYAELFYRIVDNDREGARRIARAIVKEKQHPSPPAWHRAAVKYWEYEDVFGDDVDNE
ncbi:TPA: hypothetical protein DDZ10_04390 [Candidatus Uhrbacteria bacterium]|nr:MAG: hypothetical protein UY79_C0005G0060 [Parcubacteria group bacterium GW2011_GWA2_53_21]OGL71662.1 MAG: hypothetical protein A3D69_02140 [Candidatus Uhrbacteria bacterium RIFCSPHIGHO2_02_FULL_54_11]HBL39874.1 hypothetical protein [Candidatus Uhrbacteria bacterium]